MKHYFFATLLFLLAMTACKASQTKEMGNKPTCQPVVQDAALYEANSDPFTLVSASMDGKCLKIDVEYGGGCGEAEFTLVWNGAMMKSMPPQVPMKLHLVDKDNCRSIVRKSLCFDVDQVYDGDFVILLKDFEGKLMYLKKK